MASTDDEAVVLKAVRLACLKAFAGMLANNYGKNCLTASAVAANVLAHYKLPFTVVVGYYQFMHPEFPQDVAQAVVKTSFPHVWLETCHGVTDLAYSGVARKIMVLGQGIAFHDDALRPTYSAEPLLPVFAGAEGAPRPLPFAVLAGAASNLTQYMDKSPDHVRREVAKILTSAFDGTDEIKLNPADIDSNGVISGNPGGTGGSVRT
jgi:hypothetical protein